MEEEVNQRRMYLAAALCLAVITLWQAFLAPSPPKRKSAADKGAVAAATKEPAKTTKTSTSAAKPVFEAKPRSPVAPTSFKFSGQVPGGEEDPIRYDITLTNVGAAIDRFELLSYKERDRDNRPTNDPIGLANPVAGSPRNDGYGQMAGIEFLEPTTFRVPTRSVYEVKEESADRILYKYTTDEGVEIEREYRFRKDSFEVELAVTVRNRSPREQKHRLQIHGALIASEAMEQGGGFLSRFVPPPDHLDLLCHVGNEVEREHHQSLRDESQPIRFKGPARWVAVDRQYFVAALIPRGRDEASCSLSAAKDIGQAALVLPSVSLKAGEEKRHKFTAYLGVKKPALLTQVEADLESAVDYTIFGLNLSLLCTALLWVLRLIHGWTGSWGLAILGLTVLVKLILFPLNQRSGKSMRAMARLKPAMEAIRKKFPDDRQRQSEETMKLYREHGVNPAGGCLPMLIQMPIWFALYRSLWVAVDLYQQEFLWMRDLTTADPYYILPVALIVVMFLQQRMTPTTMDATQQKIMQYTMPLVFGGMMSALPGGLCFYILVNTLLTIVQQHFINKAHGPLGGAPSVQEATA